MKSLSAAIIVTAGLASLTAAPWLVQRDSYVLIMIVASIATAVGLAGWTTTWTTTNREPRDPNS